MFKTPITSTPLTSEAADAFFQNITGNAFQEDESLLATLRAHIAPRIAPTESLALKFTRSDYASNNLNGCSNDVILNAIIEKGIPVVHPGRITIHNFASSDDEANRTCMKSVEDDFASRHKGYCQLDRMTVFFRKSFPVLCYVNTELKSTIIFIERLDLKKLHYLQCAILAALPWYFNPEDGLPEIEMELIQSLRESTADKYLECIAKIAATYDFRSSRIRQMLEGFETRFEEAECEQLRETIARTDREISSLNSRIGDHLANRAASCARLLGFEAKITQAGEESEIMEYFLCNNKLSLDRVTNSELRFSVGDYITYFDKDMVERMLENKGSYVYRGDNGRAYSRIEGERMAKLLHAVFVEESLRIKTCAAYAFVLRGNVSPLSRFVFPFEFNDCMPNPHINEYSCLGNYGRTINEILAENDYIGAIEQCVASCKSLNWGDSTVMQSFMKTLHGKTDINNRCIELPDGSVVRPLQAIEWLEQQGGESSEEETTEEA